MDQEKPSNTNHPSSEEHKSIQDQFFVRPDRFGALVGYKLEKIDREAARSLVSLQVEEKHLSPSGAMHGGVMSTLIDAAMGVAILGQLAPGQICSTIEFKLNYLSPVRLGERLLGEALVCHLGRTHAVVEIEVLAGDRKVARALGTFNLYYPGSVSSAG